MPFLLEDSNDLLCPATENGQLVSVPGSRWISAASTVITEVRDFPHVCVFTSLLRYRGAVRDETLDDGGGVWGRGLSFFHPNLLRKTKSYDKNLSCSCRLSCGGRSVYKL